MKFLKGIVLWILGIGAISYGQNIANGKDIYRANCGAVVLISAGTQSGFAPGNEFGVGFITSENGRIITANHVITTRESGYRQYAAHVTVFVPGKPSPYSAQTINTAPSEDQTNHDAAVVKIDATKLPHVTLGDWNKTEVGDQVTILSTFPGFGCLLLKGGVVAKSSPPNPVDTILFQIPIRNGFSGSPIFDKDGKVIGIEDTKVFGISPALGQLRNQWNATQQGGHVRILGIDMAGSFIQVIDNLDQNLISGLGSGVSVNYAEQVKSKTGQ